MLKSNDIVLRGNEQKIKYTKIRFDPIPPGTSGGCSRTIHSLAFCFEGRFMFLLFVLFSFVPPGETLSITFLALITVSPSAFFRGCMF